MSEQLFFQSRSSFHFSEKSKHRGGKEERWVRAGMKEMWDKAQMSSSERRGCVDGGSIKTPSLWGPTDVLQGISCMRLGRVRRSVGGSRAAFRARACQPTCPALCRWLLNTDPCHLHHIWISDLSSVIAKINGTLRYTRLEPNCNVPKSGKHPLASVVSGCRK